MTSEESRRDIPGVGLTGLLTVLSVGVASEVSAGEVGRAMGVLSAVAEIARVSSVVAVGTKVVLV
jgi:hypothetical protein